MKGELAMVMMRQTAAENIDQTNIARELVLVVARRVDNVMVTVRTEGLLASRKHDDQKI